MINKIGFTLALFIAWFFFLLLLGMALYCGARLICENLANDFWAMFESIYGLGLCAVIAIGGTICSLRYLKKLSEIR